MSETNTSKSATTAEIRPRVADNVYTDMTMQIGMAKAILQIVHDAAGISADGHDATMAVYAAHGHLERALEFAEELHGMKPAGGPQS